MHLIGTWYKTEFFHGNEKFHDLLVDTVELNKSHYVAKYIFLCIK